MVPKQAYVQRPDVTSVQPFACTLAQVRRGVQHDRLLPPQHSNHIAPSRKLWYHCAA
jgi:hypothetical protein